MVWYANGGAYFADAQNENFLALGFFLQFRSLVQSSLKTEHIEHLLSPYTTRFTRHRVMRGVLFHKSNEIITQEIQGTTQGKANILVRYRVISRTV